MAAGVGANITDVQTIEHFTNGAANGNISVDLGQSGSANILDLAGNYNNSTLVTVTNILGSERSSMGTNMGNSGRRPEPPPPRRPCHQLAAQCARRFTGHWRKSPDFRLHRHRRDPPQHQFHRRSGCEHARHGRTEFRSITSTSLAMSLLPGAISLRQPGWRCHQCRHFHGRSYPFISGGSQT